MNREAWLAERRTGIGGTDAANILGVGFGTAYDVWLEKTRALPQVRPNEAMWWGSALEAVIAERYMVETGRKVWSPERVFYNDRWPVLRGTPDRLCIGLARGVEVKTASFHARESWGEPGTDRIPDGYLVQCAVYMAVTGFPQWDVAALIGGNDFRLYHVRRNEEFEAFLIERLTAWWTRHVEGGEPPPLTGADSTSRALSRAFARDMDVRLDPTPDAEMWAGVLGMARGEIERLELTRKEAENNLKALLGDATEMRTESWRITWRNTKDSEKVNWRAVANELADHYNALRRGSGSGETSDNLIAELIAKHTEQAPGERRFLYTPLIDGETVQKAMKRLAAAGGIE